MGLGTVLTGGSMGVLFMCSVNALRRVRLLQSEQGFALASTERVS